MLYESEEVVLGESLPLSELLLVISAVSSAAAAMDIIRSSSGIEYKNTQSDRQCNHTVSTVYPQISKVPPSPRLLSLLISKIGFYILEQSVIISLLGLTLCLDLHMQ